MDAGMKDLIEYFYRSIRENNPVPIPYREILLTSRIMDTIFEQLRDQDSDDSLADRSEVDLAVQPQPAVFEIAEPTLKP
jgi:capsular polysaccharide biosynthesis protein